jgi:hypothetical protein
LDAGKRLERGVCGTPDGAILCLFAARENNASGWLFIAMEVTAMGRLAPLLLFALFSGLPLAAAADDSKTIEGYWQDSARRILFARGAPPSYIYGQWTMLDPEQTYPSAKHIRRSPPGFDLVDLLYDDQEAIRVVGAREDAIEFTRTTKWSACSTHHRCALRAGELLCALESRCPEPGGEALVWRGEERYVRRASCERNGGREAQGIPVKCR